MIKIGKNSSLRFNIMVVGESGLGKITFLNSLLQDLNPGIILNSSSNLTGLNKI